MSISSSGYGARASITNLKASRPKRLGQGLQELHKIDVQRLDMRLTSQSTTIMLRQSTFKQLPRSFGSAAKAATRTPASRRTFLSPPRSQPNEHLNRLDVNKLSEQQLKYARNRRAFLWTGLFCSVSSMIYVGYLIKLELKKPIQADSSLPSTDPLAGTNAAERKVVLRDEKGHELVPTGNSTVPTFPRTLELGSFEGAIAPGPSASGLAPTITGPDQTEYTLVGFGLRTVTFIGIQVYVVGYYVATADVASLQSALTKKVNPIATTLVAGERDQLRTDLLDPAKGKEIWDGLLANGIPARSVFRVIPVRDTDFHHLRDGFVRAIQARAGKVGDEQFGEAMKDFRQIFNRGKVPAKQELLLIRDGEGKLSVVYDDGGNKKEGRPAGRQLVGTVDDERVSRALWLNYLAGKKVASEPARKSIVEGIMEFVERPVGTIAAQVV
ncbi:chalcone-flavanone isomerase-domain-containing protein [Neurospora hispaniola]|uniref:Chalcone-flavanone isomerase-domain-containing protein n=1 Tax=Neurospora hispaniola TaxID=588809 RepID=A0AAJ0MVC8_9PEZI|nr:chalcone-flavanone isomerase-domain-containing protein [Neurospora hispaniola]